MQINIDFDIKHSKPQRTELVVLLIYKHKIYQLFSSPNPDTSNKHAYIYIFKLSLYYTTYLLQDINTINIIYKLLVIARPLLDADNSDLHIL